MATEDSYHDAIEADVSRAVELADRARSRGGDPTQSVEIPIATDMADRVENLLGFDGLADRIRDIEGSMSREHAALTLAKAFAQGELGSFERDEARVEAAVRTAVALLTEGVVAAPIEGIDRVAIEEGPGGSSYVRIWYAGPIRSAGGTAQALSVLVADYTRSLLGLDAYEPTEIEVNRLVEEIELYERETGLQYTPSPAETELIANHCPVMLDGEPTTDDEVDSYRDLASIDTNRGRGGMCLVLAEGIAQKADKLARYVDDLEAVEWPWLDDLRGETVDEDETEDSTDPGIEPDNGYLKDLIAGRPVFGHPSEAGGFRLRYGRARNHGLATAGVHPATMYIVDKFLAPGTQLKTELPGKAAGVVPVDTMDGPTIRLTDGRVRRIDDIEEARTIQEEDRVDAVLDLGEYLVNVGEFVENNHPLVPGAYDRHRWALEMAEAGADVQAIKDAPEQSMIDPRPGRALSWAREYDAPLHPAYTYLYHDVSGEAIEDLADAIESGTETETGLVVDATITPILERLLVEHDQRDDGCLIPAWRPLATTLGFDDDRTRDWSSVDHDDGLTAVSALAPFDIRARAPTRVGARMGRPEKSEPRKLKPSVHGLFPVGAAGGDQRSVEEAASYAPDRNGDSGSIEVEVNRRACQACGTQTMHARCPSCDGFTEPVYRCPSCDTHIEVDESGRRVCGRCNREATCVETRTVDIDQSFDEALDRVGVRRRSLELLKGVKGLTSATKTPEPMEKGILRAKHDLSVFKDGTIRYDMTDLPVTAVTPGELGVDAETFRELGYETDCDGEPLQYDDQVVELAYQDIVLSEDAAEYLLQAADFVDELLESYYGMEPFYELDESGDLVGELVLGLAPHTSAAVVGRVVGFTSAAVGYAHPFFHAAKRRNADGDEDCVMLLMDGLLNFSEYYLPESRGGRMDAPLVMSTRIDPAEIDDEAHNIETVESYPLDLYEAADRYGDPSETSVTLAADAIEAGDRVSFGHTDNSTDIAMGPDLSAYKTLDSMQDKLDAQLELATCISAVRSADVAERVIEGHYLPDLLGNLRAFSSQETRCQDCGRKYRRVPLTGSCLECGGTVLLTVYEGMVVKYLEPAMEIAEDYDVRPYTRQRLEVLERSLESLFQDDTDKQAGIADFM